MSDKIEITLIRSAIGRSDLQKKTIEAIGLKKLNEPIVRQNSPAIQGMIDKVSHLVQVKEV